MRTVKYKDVEFYIGQNANENWELLDNSKKINDKYVWFHLNSFASPYVIMYETIDELKKKYNIIEINQLLYFGGELCKENSKYKYLKPIKILYTTLNKLTKTEKVGEVTISGKKNLLSI